MNAILTTPPLHIFTLAELLRQLGDISPARIRMQPPPGTATSALVAENKCCELVEGTLVEKAMGYPESILAIYLARLLGSFVDDHDLGIISGADGMFRLNASLVRIPDVAFVSWNRLPNRKIPSDPVPDLAPDLAIEVLSEGNTAAEMQRKIQEYFAAGVRAVWIIDRRIECVTIYRSEVNSLTLGSSDTIDGEDVLPGFQLPIRKLFDYLRKHQE